METTSGNLVYIDDYGLRGFNFYYRRYERFDLTTEDLASIGLSDDRGQVHRDIIDSLVAIDQALEDTLGYRLYIKEGYRSKELYELVYEKRVAKFGKEETDRLLNMDDMPHATGCSVDIALWDEKEDKGVYMRDGKDDPDAFFIDFYKGKDTDKAKRYQYLQETVVETMRKYGFCLGIKQEYFHFNYCEKE